MSLPIRIQRKRTAGYNMQSQSPDGRPVVSCCRPGKWGNPFAVTNEEKGFGVTVIEPNERKVNIRQKYPYRFDDREQAARASILMYQEYVNPYRHGGSLEDFEVSRTFMNTVADELRGKHLACFCKLSDPCHVDYLLQKAN